MILVGCGRNSSLNETDALVVTADPASLAEPFGSPETEPSIVQHPGDRADGTVTTDGVEHTIVGLEEHETPITSVPSAPSENTAPVPTSGSDNGSSSERFTGVMGTEFVVPEDFIQLYESPSIGYQYTFWHPDYEIRIVVYEIAPGYIPEGAYETDYSFAKNNPDVTYFNQGENWFVQSGYNNNGEEIFYSKECSTDNGLKTFWITYPTAKREFGDRITAEFEANFSF